MRRLPAAPRGMQPKTNRIRLSTVIRIVSAVAAISVACLAYALSSFALTKRNGDDPTRIARPPPIIKSPPLRKPVRLEIYHLSDECRGDNVTVLEARPNRPPVAVDLTGKTELLAPKSLRVVGRGELELFNHDGKYIATALEMEDCVKLFPWPPIARGTLKYGTRSHRVSPSVQAKLSTASSLSKPHTRVVFSCESADYFGYQTVTNAYAFFNSNQTEASWLRLLTSREPDDLAASLPTFTAPRTLYSKRYVPFNKPDIIDKWLRSDDAPHPDDTVVVIDPDNWLLKDMHPWTLQVMTKQAYGQAAYYDGNPKVQQLWKEICKQGCNNTVDTVGVPYVLKASDLKEVAPLWREYTYILKELRENAEDDSRFVNEYKYLGLGWAAEMFGYNYACAHLGIKTKVVHDLQIRDVDPRVSKEKAERKAMIHMGRAWFPNKHAALAEKWRHTEGKDFREFGIQVWCKCNRTGSTIMPWPIPDGLDFQSYHTLRLLHEAKEWFGPIPKNETLRPSNGESIN